MAHLFTGDALFAGGAGRTDFIGGSAEDLFDTLRAFEGLPDGTVVHPGHDYVGRAITTIGEEKADNPLLRAGPGGLRRPALHEVRASPNMAAIVRHNLGEAAAATLTGWDLQFLRNQGRGPLLLDVRSPIEFESERIDGALNLPLDALPARLDEIAEGADLVVICRTECGQPSRPRRCSGPAAGLACSTVGYRRGAAPACRCGKAVNACLSIAKSS